MGTTSKNLIVSLGFSVIVYFVQAYRSAIQAENFKRAVNDSCGDGAPSTCGIPGDGDAAYQYVTMVDRMAITDFVFAMVSGVIAFAFLSITFNGRAL